MTNDIAFFAYTHPPVSFTYRNRCIFNYLHLNHSLFYLIPVHYKLSHNSKFLHKKTIKLLFEYFCFYLQVSLYFFSKCITLSRQIALTIVNLTSTIQISNSMSFNFLLFLYQPILRKSSLRLPSHLFPLFSFIPFLPLL